MRAIAILKFGGPENLIPMALPCPEPARGEVLIRVVSAGVNRVDSLIRSGALDEQFPHRFPLIPGWDVAGVVEAFGDGTGRFRKGDRVWACARKPTAQWGTYAEYVSIPEDWAALVGRAVDHFGGLHGLVNNAGILLSSPILEMDVEDYRRVLDVNLVGAFLGVQRAGRAMRDAGGGSIVNVSSTAGFKAVPTASAYVSSKFGMRGLTRTAALELGRYGIRVNSIHPGGVDTEMARSFGGRTEPVSSEDSIHSQLPLGRIGQPIEMAHLALFLISDDSSYCTGSEFVADGGLLV